MMNILYITNTGNTKDMCKKLQKYAKKQRIKDNKAPLIKLKEISEQTDLFKNKDEFFCFVPTYVMGGDTQMDIEMQNHKPIEIETVAMNEQLGYDGNYKNCLGIVGSGNKNFNYLYCYTAKLYSHKYGIPFVADYELRGTKYDVKHVYNVLAKIWQKK